jgi:CRP/FNR family cyclic AMP-dependent transcriptional regulator
MTENIAALIGSHRFFAGMKQDHIESIASCAQLKSFNAGTMVGRENTPSMEFFAVLEGKVAIETYQPGSSPAVLQTLQTGEIVGWSWLFEPHHWVFDAKAITNIKVIAFDGVCLRQLCEQNPVVGFELMKRMARVMTYRLKATRLQLLDLYGHKDNERTFGIGL